MLGWRVVEDGTRGARTSVRFAAVECCPKRLRVVDEYRQDCARKTASTILPEADERASDRCGRNRRRRRSPRQPRTDQKSISLAGRGQRPDGPTMSGRVHITLAVNGSFGEPSPGNRRDCRRGRADSRTAFTSPDGVLRSLPAPMEGAPLASSWSDPSRNPRHALMHIRRSDGVRSGSFRGRDWWGVW